MDHFALHVTVMKLQTQACAGAGKVLGCEEFLPDIHQTYPKSLCAFFPQIFSHKEHEDLFLVRPPKEVLTVFFRKRWAPLFEVKQSWAPFLPEFSGILPRFSEVLPKFSEILLKFLTNQNF